MIIIVTLGAECLFSLQNFPIDGMTNVSLKQCLELAREGVGSNHVFPGKKRKTTNFEFCFCFVFLKTYSLQIKTLGKKPLNS